MNQIFKTIWSAARQQYIVSNEKHASRGKAGKSAVLAVAVASAFVAGAASAYTPSWMTNELNGFLAQNRGGWETAEYQADWGLNAMNASVAYSLGYTGKGAHVGVMDSGALLSHPDLASDRITGTHVTGNYGSDGVRYPQNASGTSDTLAYNKGQAFDVTGDWMLGVNDSHGTHVTGTVGGNRDGSEFHGVAFDAQVTVGNTGATDSNNYGPYQDHDYFLAGWKAMVDAGARVINNSWGTNIRVLVDKDKNLVSYADYQANKDKLADKIASKEWAVGHIPTNSVQQAEYEYFYFMNTYVGAGKDANFESSFVDAAWEAVKGKDVVQVFTTGNRDSANPFYRPLYPYFNPEAESQWIAVAGLQKAGTDAQGRDKYELIETFNEAGLGKWWTVAAPGRNIYSSKVDTKTGEALWGNSSGTSMAAPHVTGAMGVLLSRYPDMTAAQVRNVMFTTANHKNPDGSNMDGWDNVDGTTPLEGQVSDRMGWGVPDLAKGMFGPGQFLGNMAYDMKTQKLDVWSNDISNVALDQRRAEDEKWLADYDKNLAADDYVLGDDFALIVPEAMEGKTQISKEDAKNWRETYFIKKRDDIKQKLDSGWYNGSVTKSGDGTLVMTGANSYKGATKVDGGTLLAFTESIGTDNTVSVGANGTFGVLAAYDDQFTRTGYKESAHTADDLVTVNITENGGSLYVSAAGDVQLKNVNFDNGVEKKVTVGLQGASHKKLVEAYRSGEAVKSTLTTTEKVDFSGIKVTAGDESAFFTVPTDGVVGGDSKIDVSVQKKADVSFATFARTKNERAIASALERSSNDFMGYVLTKSADEINGIYAGLTDDFYATARNALAVNSLMVTRTVTDQARGMGEGRSAEFANGMGRVWAAGVGTWGDAKGNAQNLDVDFRTGLVGVEFNAIESTKIGAFFGGGSTDYKGTNGKIDADNLNYGLYGLSDIGPVALTYGVSYTTEDRDTTHALGGIVNTHSEDASVLQFYGEAAYTGLKLSALQVEPYVGFAWAKVETDGFTETNGAYDFHTKDVDDDIQVSTLGTRFTLPFNWETLPVAVKADLGWSHFYGDTESYSMLQLGQGGAYAQLEGNELKDQFNLGLGIEAQVGKSATLGVSYVGAWGSDTDVHGVTANFRWAF